MTYDCIVIGGGPAGMSAALSSKNSGAGKVLIVERNDSLGGILNQCIHTGFGLQYFKEELTGPEYAGRFIELIQKTDIEIMLNTFVIEITKEKRVCVSNENGMFILNAKSIILAMGCRERSRCAIALPGDRPSGILTAGTAQYYVNIEGYMVGKKVVILGSGDVGLIMAKRLTLEGARVLACVEIMPHSNGLTRNIVQCLDDFNIPLYLSHTITDVKGEGRLSKVTVSKVDRNKSIVPNSSFDIECDCLLLSVGLIPENELSSQLGIAIDSRTKGPVVNQTMQTSIDGVFACGNVAHVHDMVDYVTYESETAGKNAALYARGLLEPQRNEAEITAGGGITYTMPQKIDLETLEETIDIYFRVGGIYRDAVINFNDAVKFKKQFMTPGEMQKITVRKKFLTKAAQFNIKMEE